MELLALPSKRVGLFTDPALASLIARSDSNGEDLESFAGAGEGLRAACGTACTSALSRLWTKPQHRAPCANKLGTLCTGQPRRLVRLRVGP